MLGENFIEIPGGVFLHQDSKFSGEIIFLEINYNALSNFILKFS